MNARGTRRNWRWGACAAGLGVIVAGCATARAASAPTPSEPGAATVSESRELLPDEQVQQVLNRLAFGPRPGEAAQVRKMGVDAWIERQLYPDRIQDPAVDQLAQSYPVLQQPTSEIVQDYSLVQRARRQAGAREANRGADSAGAAAARRQALTGDPSLAAAVQQNRQLVGAVQSDALARAVVSNRELQEVMVDFWENHFSVYSGKGQTRLFLPDYDARVIRPYALGKFRDLLGAVAKSPAMLFFLDNWQSVADSTHPTLASSSGQRGLFRMARVGHGVLRRPVAAGAPGTARQAGQAGNAAPKRGLNENYGRELMELHTLGVDGGYTQKDVQEVARALTGWTFDRQTGAFVFRPALHDAGSKVVLGHVLPAGRGIQDGEDVLDILAAAPQTAHFITTKLARHFVSDDPPASLVDRCAQTFQRTQGDIRETMRCIVTSPEFFSRAAYRAKVKTPFEVVASGLRALGASPDTTPRSAQIVARLGEPIFGRQTPDGWPDRGDAWMNTGAILNRINFGLALAGGQVPGARLASWPEADSLSRLPHEQQVDGVIQALLGGQASTETRDVLMSGSNPMLAATVSAPTDTTMDAMTLPRGARGRQGAGRQGGGRQQQPFQPVQLRGLAQVVGLALGAPEFQRR